ncbi:unnamed protein product [Aphanomyces euteiches]|uniref:Transmembrane protein n=1 Tax=Aphanomyces euteiches TaxID=100861 RepID=A0A6G0XH44_9STRA|nr:hypothetical protein Ae201684_004809 [Aphanomyces euteiches]KAH9073161.1 hypothetical protein Ae201684P_014978 [Aphanomyces euteiches]
MPHAPPSAAATDLATKPTPTTMTSFVPFDDSKDSKSQNVIKRGVALSICIWVVCMSIEVVAYLIVPIWVSNDVSTLLASLLARGYCLMTNFDTGPSMSAWDVSLYTGYNVTATENEARLRRLIDQIDTWPLGSSTPLDVPVGKIPFTMTLGPKINFLQSVSKTNQTVDAESGRYTLMVGKTFSLSNPVFSPLVSLVLYVKMANKVHGYETLRVFRTISSNSTHQSLVDVTLTYPTLLGVANRLICVTNYDAATVKCGSIVLPNTTTLVVDEQKKNGGLTTPPSCTHPQIKNMVYSITDPDAINFYCASDPTTIAGLLTFENWMVLTSIPNVDNQRMLSSVHHAPTGFRLPLSTEGFLDAAPNATAVMTPTMQIANQLWTDQASRVDYIIQTQIAILLITRLASAGFYLALLVKFSWKSGRNLFLVLVDYFSLEVTNNSSFEITVALTLITTFWTYRGMILAMIVRQCLAPLPWNLSSMHSFTDDLVFIPGPICFIFVVGMSVIKHVLNACRMCVRLSYVTIYLAIVLLVAGALSHQGPAFTSVRSVDPYTYRPTLVAPMVMFYYRTSPHLDSYFYMAYAAIGAMVAAAIASKIWLYFRKVRVVRQIQSGSFHNSILANYSTFDVTVGLAIRFPGGFMDTSRLYAHGEGAKRFKSTVYSVAMAGYVEIDGCLMPTTSVQRCFAAYFLGSSVDTSGPIHYFKLSEDGKTVENRIYRTFPTLFVRGKPMGNLFRSLSLREFE